MAVPSFGSTQIELGGRHFYVKSGKCVSNVEASHFNNDEKSDDDCDSANVERL